MNIGRVFSFAAVATANLIVFIAAATRLKIRHLLLHLEELCPQGQQNLRQTVVAAATAAGLVLHLLLWHGGCSSCVVGRS